MAHGGEDDLRAVVLPTVAAAGFDLEDITVGRSGQARLVRVIVDRDGGVDLDAAADLSRALSSQLDAAGDDVFGGAGYTLEVTSPGIGRPLTEPRHFRRAAGRLATLTLRDGSSAVVRLAGIGGVAGDDLQILTGADGLTLERLPLADIAHARIEPEFSAPPAAVLALLADLAAARDHGTNPSEGPDEGEGAR